MLDLLDKRDEINWPRNSHIASYVHGYAILKQINYFIQVDIMHYLLSQLFAQQRFQIMPLEVSGLAWLSKTRLQSELFQ